MTMGCSSSFGGGAPFPTSSRGVACEARKGPSLRAARPTQPTAIIQLAGGATNGELLALPASSARKKGGLPYSEPAASLQAPKARVWMGSDVARCPLTSRGVSSRALRRSRERRGRRGQTQGARLLTGSCAQRGRGSDARVGVPARRSLFAEVDRRRRTQRSVRSSFHPIWGADVDGGLADG